MRVGASVLFIESSSRGAMTGPWTIVACLTPHRATSFAPILAQTSAWAMLLQILPAETPVRIFRCIAAPLSPRVETLLAL